MQGFLFDLTPRVWSRIHCARIFVTIFSGCDNMRSASHDGPPGRWAHTHACRGGMTPFRSTGPPHPRTCNVQETFIPTIRSCRAMSPPEAGKWSSTLFGCFSDCGTCCYGARTGAEIDRIPVISIGILLYPYAVQAIFIAPHAAIDSWWMQVVGVVLAFTAKTPRL